MQKMNNGRGAIETRKVADLAAPQLMISIVLLFLFSSFARINFLISLKIGFIALIAVILALLIKKNWQWTKSHTGMLVYLSLAAISILFAENNFAAYRWTLVYLPFVGIAIGFAWIMSAPKTSKQLIFVWLASLAYVSFYAITHNGRGPGGYAGDENDMALTAAMGLSFALFGVGTKSGWFKVVSAVLIFLFITSSVISFSRGGMIAMGAVGLFYFVSTENKIRKGFLVMALISLTLSFAPQKYVSELQSIGGELESDSAYSTGQIRLFMWAAAINAFKDNPILGVGAGNYSWSVGKYQPTEGNWPPAFFVRDRTRQSAHSFYFQLLAEQGIVGVSVIGFLVIRFFRNLNRIAKSRSYTEPDEAGGWGYLSRPYLALAIMGAMIGFLSAGVFLSVLNYPHFFYLIGMGAGLEIASPTEIEDKKQSSDVNPKLLHR